MVREQIASLVQRLLYNDRLFWCKTHARAHLIDGPCLKWICECPAFSLQLRFSLPARPSNSATRNVLRRSGREDGRSTPRLSVTYDSTSHAGIPKGATARLMLYLARATVVNGTNQISAAFANKYAPQELWDAASSDFPNRKLIKTVKHNWVVSAYMQLAMFFMTIEERYIVTAALQRLALVVKGIATQYPHRSRARVHEYHNGGFQVAAAFIHGSLRWIGPSIRLVTKPATGGIALHVCPW